MKRLGLAKRARVVGVTAIVCAVLFVAEPTVVGLLFSAGSAQASYLPSALVLAFPAAILLHNWTARMMRPSAP